MIADWVSPDELQNSTDELAPSAAAAASRILWSLTGRRYSGRRTLVEEYEPDVGACGDLLNAGLLAAGIAPLSRVDRPYRVGPRGELYVPLNARPVRSITRVVAPRGGAAVDPALYSIVNNAYLALSVCVPTLSGLEVTYVAGSDLPRGAREAALALADELVNLFNDCDDCRLKNVTSVSRQGMTIEVEDAHSILDEGRTGIPEVDLFVTSVNPTKSKTPARIFSPDAYRRVTRSR